jgi:hypothetical protein
MPGGYDGRMMVKQYVAVVASRWCRFMVFETQDARWYLFSQLDSGGCTTGLQFPVRKADLLPEVRRALVHGYGNASL